jgi:hypothetical protein
MRTAALAASFCLIAGGALAQAAPAAAPPPLGPPRAFAGYSQPAIGAAACRMVTPAQAQCVVPAMTAGRYLLDASGTSTWTAAGATQTLVIQIGGTRCAAVQDKAPWTSGARTFKVDCVVTLLTDRPLIAAVGYGDEHATKDPRGPSLTFRPLPWEGVLSAAAFVPKQ